MTLAVLRALDPLPGLGPVSPLVDRRSNEWAESQDRESSTILRRCARQRGQYLIASEGTLAVIVSPQRGQFRRESLVGIVRPEV
jgi:hypothetical protein